MDVFTAIKTRRSIRAYQDRPVEEERLNRVLEAGRLAPSARNLQEWKFVVVKDPESRRKLATAACNQKFVGEAPVVIVACALKSEHVMTCGQPAYTVDVSIAVDHMILQAVEEGLGTCWLGAFYEDQVKQILGIPDDIRVVAMFTLGYPKHIPNPTPRKSPEETFVYERWS